MVWPQAERSARQPNSALKGKPIKLGTNAKRMECKTKRSLLTTSMNGKKDSELRGCVGTTVVSLCHQISSEIPLRSHHCHRYIKKQKLAK